MFTAAAGALRHAFHHLGDVDGHVRLGLYSGWPGIALAGVRAAHLLDEQEWLERGCDLLRRTEREQLGAIPADGGAGSEEFDLIAGRAGALVALLRVHGFTGDEYLVDAAVQLADRLVSSAEATGHGWSWRSPGHRRKENLTGFSHGAAGVAFALVEAFRETGDQRYRDAAEQAFRYERHWFDPAAGNWPDFREGRAPGRRVGRRFPFATLWCHGAPGIALSRLHAYQVLGDPVCRDEATVALATTRRAILSALGTGSANFSLCHGVAGNAEAILHARRILSDAPVSDETPERVGSAGVDRYASTSTPWPCGTHTAETSNLMLGLAGIGYFYLRLHDATVPSVLLPACA